MYDNASLVEYWEKGNGKFVECECHHYTFMSLEHLRNQHEAVASTFDRYKEKEKNDPVNHPAHYTSDPSGIECITITRHRNFNIGNAIKYLWRAGLKDQDTLVQDLRKAVWYIEDEIKRIEDK